MCTLCLLGVARGNVDLVGVGGRVGGRGGGPARANVRVAVHVAAELARVCAEDLDVTTVVAVTAFRADAPGAHFRDVWVLTEEGAVAVQDEGH